MSTVPRHVVAVPVATVWTSPDAPRPVDAKAVADQPDVVAWLAELDAHPDDDESGDGRLGLHDRVVTQLVDGEPVEVIPVDHPEALPDGWVEVVAPWQPSSQDPRGYPGWVRRAHLSPGPTPAGAPARTEGHPQDAVPDAGAALELARSHLGLAYLWGGTSQLGLDCSGLVHVVHRELGRVLPRDAHDQQAVIEPVDVDDVRPGDLYFFSRGGRPAHHVGIVTGPGRMIHAAEGVGVVEEDLDDDRLATLTAAGRVAS